MCIQIHAALLNCRGIIFGIKEQYPQILVEFLINATVFHCYVFDGSQLVRSAHLVHFHCEFESPESVFIVGANSILPHLCITTLLFDNDSTNIQPSTISRSASLELVQRWLGTFYRCPVSRTSLVPWLIMIK